MSLEPSANPEPPVESPEPPPPIWAARAVAIIEVLICSDYPTQVAIGATFNAFGYTPFVHGQLRPGFVVAGSLADAILLIGLILLFLYSHQESPIDLFFGRRRIWGEVAVGIPMTFVALGIAMIVLFAVQHLAPQLHTVPENPLQGMMKTPLNAAMFAVVVIVAGGVREEIQRAFLLHRFEQWLGGRTVGVVVTSVAFGAGHLGLQGVDAAIATGLLGAFWAVVYLRRRSIVAPMVSHAGFDLLQIVQFLAGGR